MFYAILYAYLISVGSAFIVSVPVLRKKYPLHFRIFALILALTMIVEVTANFVFPKFHITSKYRNATYNIFALMEFLVYTYFLYKTIKVAWVKKIQLFFLIGFPFTWVFLVSDGKGIMDFHGSVIAFGGFFIVCFALAYLFFLSGNLDVKKVFRLPEFWISLGLILFYCCETPYMGAMAYLVKYYLSIAKALIYISMTINTIMYLLFGYAFICLRRNYS